MNLQDYIVQELRELKTEVKGVREDIIKLKVRSSLWGGLSGLVSGVVVLAWALLQSQ